MFKTLSKMIVLLSAVLMPVSVLAISLGDSEVLSSLGEPIRVEIEILEWQQTDLNQLEVALASEANFDAFGLDYLPELTGLQLSILEVENGELMIELNSSIRMQEPFLDILLVLRWRGGSLLREYIFLFDPPSIQVSNIVIEEEPAVVPETEEEQVPAPIMAQAEAQIEQVQEAAASPVIDDEPVITESIEVEVVIERRIYLVQPGDSLFNIALQFRPAEEDENFYQMLLSTYELNPNAFEDGNISLLIANEEIIIPGSDDINNIDRASAEERYNQLMEEGAAVFDIEEEPLPLVNNLAPANQVPAEAVPVASIPEQEEIPANRQENVQAGETLLVQDSPSINVSSSEFVESTSPASGNLGSGVVLRGPDEDSQIQALIDNRALQRQQLATQVEAIRLQISEVQSYTVRITQTVESVRANRAAQQKTVNLIVYILAAFALGLTLALIFFVMRGSRRGSRS